MRHKVVATGDAGFGKSCLLAVVRYPDRLWAFWSHSDSVTRKVLIDDTFVTLHIWDTAGQERYRLLPMRFY